MAGFPVFTTLQPIVGVDFHKAVPPPPPAGPVMMPHIVVWGSGLSQSTGFLWAVASTSKASSPSSAVAKPVCVGCGHACGQGHDAGPHPAHIWPNALLPLILLGSASKAEWGSGTVMISVSQVQGGSANIAVNLAYVLNPNLDCQDFPLPPLPTGLCFSVNYTVYAGFSWSDVLRGFLHMLADMALTWAVGAVAAVLSGAIQGLLSSLGKGGVMRAMGQAIASNFSIASEAGVKSAAGLMADGAGYFASNGRVFVDGWKFMPAALANWFESAPANQVVGLAASVGSTFGPGTPIGYAPINAPVGGAAPTSISSKLSQAIDNLFQ